MRIVRIFARLTRFSGITPGVQPVNTDILALVKDIQDRVSEVAYLMWESAGRQHGMALEYWLAAEREVISTMQSAAERMMPAQAPGAEEAANEAAPVSQTSQATVEASEAAKAVPAPAEPDSAAAAEERVPASQASEAVVEATAETAEAAAATGATAQAAKAAAKPTRRASPRSKRTPPPPS